MRRSFFVGAGLLISSFFLFSEIASAQNAVTCANPSAAPDLIRNEGKTEQIGDFFFTCTNTSTGGAGGGGGVAYTISVTAAVSLPVTSEILNAGTGASEATLLVTNADSTVIARAQGTVSGSTVTLVLSNFQIPQGTSNFDITNIRVDATPLSQNSQVTETVSVTGAGVTGVTFPAANIATVQSGITSSILSVTNYGAGATVTAGSPVTTLRFGEGYYVPNAFKTQGNNSNTTEQSWLDNNTETGYFVTVGESTNVANSGTRIRVIFSNVPAGMSLYIPITLYTDQDTSTPAGSAVLTTSEMGAFSQAPQAFPPGYEGRPLAQLTVNGGTAEAVYEIQRDSPSIAESYSVPVFLTGTVPSNAGNVNASVSLAPVGATSSIPYFAQLTSSTSVLNASQFSLNLTSTTPLATGEVGVAYNQTLVTGGTPPYNAALTSGGAQLTALGLTFNGTTGAITGTPTGTGSATITATVTDSTGASTTSPPLTLTVNPPVSILTASLPAGAVGDSYSTMLSAGSGIAPYTWSITAGSLPAGFNPINFSGPGMITGIPTVAGSYSFTLTVTDSLGGTASVIFNGTPAPKLVINSALAITTTSIPEAALNVFYSTHVSASGGVAPLTYQLVNNTSPLTAINASTGEVSTNGQPVTGGAGTHFQVKVTDAAGGTITSVVYTFWLQVKITNTTLNPASVGESWATQLSTSNGTGTIMSWMSTNLPPWLNVSPQGVLIGTPTGPGTFPVNVQVTDSAGGTNTANLNLTVTYPLAFLVENSPNMGATASIRQVSADGATDTAWVTAAGVNGTDIGVDSYGNAVVANGVGLLRVTPSGSNTLVASAPNGSQWVDAAVDRSGNFIVADNEAHKIWRVAADGSSSTLVTAYSVSNATATEHVKVAVMRNGNYFVAHDNVAGDAPIVLLIITPAGTISQPNLSGTLAYGVGGMTSDGQGNFMLLDAPNGRLIDFTPQGVGTLFAHGLPNSGSSYGVARNPLTNEYVVGFNGGLEKISANGSTLSALVSDPSNLGSPLGVAAYPQDFPSTVDLTNPLAYFRLESSTGTSEVNGTYTYAYSGGATVSNASEPPIGIPANNYAALDGNTGVITTSLSGGIATAGSMMAWVDLAALPSTSPYAFNYIAGESAQANDFDLQFSNTNVLGFFTTCCATSLNYTPDPTTLVSRWHMIVVTYDAVAGTRAIYWDGSEVASDNCPNCSSYLNKTGNFWIGNTALNASFGNRFFNGSIDDVAVWNYALSPAQVYRMYAARPVAATATISSVSPDPISVSSAPTQLTVTGSGFNTDCGACNTLWFIAPNGGVTTVAPGSTTATQIVASVPSSALQTAGIAHVSVTNSAGVPANALPLTILGPPSINPANGTSLPAGTVSQMYTQQLTASGGSGNYSWQVTNQPEGLGLSVAPLTGASVQLTGTPAFASTDGAFSVTVQLTDTSTKATASATYQLSVNPKPGAPKGQQPANTTAYVLSEDGAVYSVTNGSSTLLVPAGKCGGCFETDITRDGSGNLTVAEGQDVTAYTPAGAIVPGFPINVGKGSLSQYSSVAISSTGQLIVADNALNRLLVQGNEGLATLASFPGNGDAFVRVDSQGNYIVVSDYYRNEGGSTAISISKITPGGTVTPISVTPSPSTVAPVSVGGFTFDAAGNYVITDWSLDVIYTITPSGTSTPLFYDPNGYFSDLLGISRDRVGGSYFFVDDNVETLNTISSNGATVNQISGSVGKPSAVVVADTATGAPLTFTPAQGTLAAGYRGVPYILPLAASGGSGSDSWKIISQSNGLNLALTASSGASVSLTGTPTESDTDAGLTIEVQLTDAVTLLTLQKTYTIPVHNSALWTAAGTFDDGGTLSGSFDYGSGAVNMWNVATSAGSKLSSAFTFTPANSTAHYYSAGTGGCTDSCIVLTSNQQFPAANGNQPRVLTLAFNQVLDSNFGGTVALDTNNTNADSGSYECLQCSPIRHLSVGSVSSGVPIAPQLPGTVAYILEENGGVDAAAGGSVTQLSPGGDGLCCVDFAVDSSGNFIVAARSTILGTAPNGSPLPNFSPVMPEGAFIGSIAIDSAGNYIAADESNSRILRYAAPTAKAPSPQSTVVADLSSYGVDGDVLVRVDASGNYIVLADNSNADDGPNQLFAFSITPVGTITQIPVTTPGSILPPIATCGMTFDSNGNYVDVDCYNDEIYTVAKAGAVNQGIVSVLYSNPNSYLSDPLGITRDPHTGNFFVADDGNDSVFTFAPDGSNFSQVLTGGLLSSNSDPGAVFIVDTTAPTTTNFALQQDGTLMATVGGPTLSCGANCNGNAKDLAVDASGNFIIAAVQNLVKLTPLGVSSVIATSNGAQWVSVAVDGAGNYVVMNDAQHQLQVVSPAGAVTKTIPYNVVAADVFEHGYVRIDSNGNYILAEDNGGASSALSQIYKITPAGVVTTLTITASPILNASGLTFDANGHYVVASSGNNAIYLLTPGVGNALTASVLSNDPAFIGLQGISRDTVSGNYLVGTNVPDGLASMNAAGNQVTILLGNVASPVGTAAVTFGIANVSLAAAAQGQSYAPVNLTGIGGSGTYTWSAAGLPAGMALSVNGILSGTPTISGNFQVQITLTDTDGHSTQAMLALSVTSNAAPPPPPVTPPLTITTGALAGGTVGVSYSVSMSASGGSGAYSFTMVGAPPGLGISSGGLISGVPTAPGTFTVLISVTSASLIAQHSYTIAIAPAPLTISGLNNLGGFAPSSSISASYTANGGQAPYKWSAQNLPAGLALNASSGAITGSVASPGNYSFTIQVSDSQSLTTSEGVTMYVLGVGTSKLPDGTNHVPYLQSLAAIGGPGPYTWTTTGSFPPGLSMSSSGVVSGTPSFPPPFSTLETYIIGVSLTEGNVTVDGIITIVITVTPEKLSIPGGNPAALPDASLNVGYSQALTAAGGAPSYTWSVLAGTLPPGMGLSSSGTLAGTPTSVGSFGFTAQVKDTSGGTASSGFTINVDAPAFTITTRSPLSNAIAGSTYPAQSFAATGGNGPYTFAVTGGSLPAGLSMSDGTITGTPSAVGSSSFTITATDSSAVPLTATAEYQILVAQAHTDLVLSSSSLSFSAVAGESVVSGSDVVTVGSSGTQNLGYSLSVTPAASWLDVKGGGTTPDNISIALDPKASALPAGTVNTSIVVTCVTPSGSGTPVPCAGTSQSISVSLNVTSAPPLLSVGPGLLSFSGLTASPGTTTQSLVVQNNGGGAITVSSITSPDKFVSIGAAPASIGAGASASIGVTVNTIGVAAGYYQSSLLVSTSAGSATVPLTLLVASNATMVLAPSGTQFQMVAGSSPGNPNGSLTVDVNSTSAVNWHAAVLPGASWLTISTTSASSTSASPGKVIYTINSTAAAALSAGTYYGTIEITSSGVVNSPQDFLVVLNVNTAPDLLQPDPEPAGLIFITNGTSAVPAQTVNLYSGSQSPLAFLASVSSSDPWLSVSVGGGGTAGVGAPGSSIVSVNTTGMSAGVYRGTVSYQFTGSGASAGVRSVNVTLIIQKASSIPSVRNGNADPGAVKPQQQTSGCAPSQLVPTQTGLVNAFSQPASWPTPLNILLTDDCGNPQPNGQVVVTFSNGDAPLELSAVDTTSGNFAATWTPRNAANQITISAQGTASGFAPAVAQISGAVTPKATPVLTPNGTLNVFAPVVGAPIAPGTIIQIYGSNLSGQPGTATNIPLPTKLNSTQVLIGGRLAPLYYVSSGQINAQVPFELNVGQSYQLIVNANGALSTPNPIQLSTVAPGVAQFTDGEVIAQHLDGSLITDSSPAMPNETIVFYVAGMGPTSQNVSTGDASATANNAVDPPTLTVGGIPVTNILYAGLTPTLVGLYQVDFQVPATAPAGDQPMVLTQSGQGGQSNTTVLPVGTPPQQ